MPPFNPDISQFQRMKGASKHISLPVSAESVRLSYSDFLPTFLVVRLPQRRAVSYRWRCSFLPVTREDVCFTSQSEVTVIISGSESSPVTSSSCMRGSHPGARRRQQVQGLARAGHGSQSWGFYQRPLQCRRYPSSNSKACVT